MLPLMHTVRATCLQTLSVKCESLKRFASENGLGKTKPPKDVSEDSEKLPLVGMEMKNMQCQKKKSCVFHHCVPQSKSRPERTCTPSMMKAVNHNKMAFWALCIDSLVDHGGKGVFSRAQPTRRRHNMDPQKTRCKKTQINAKKMQKAPKLHAKSCKSSPRMCTFAGQDKISAPPGQIFIMHENKPLLLTQKCK